MLSQQAIKRTYVKKRSVSIIHILHTVKSLNKSARKAACFHRLSIYKSLTKNKLVILSTYFISKDLVLSETERKHGSGFLSVSRSAFLFQVKPTNPFFLLYLHRGLIGGCQGVRRVLPPMNPLSTPWQPPINPLSSITG